MANGFSLADNTPPGWHTPTEREDGLRIESDGDEIVESFAIVPTGTRPRLTTCPCCDKPLLTVKAAQIIAEAVYPQETEETVEQPVIKSRAEQLAEALLLVARADHYMIGIIEKVTLDERADAEQILIAAQNDLVAGTDDYKLHDLALSIIDTMAIEGRA